jgi:prepilin-type processing-associated H-X9-DG protein
LQAPLSTRALDDTALMIRPSPEAADCFATHHETQSQSLTDGSGNVLFVDGHVDSIFAADQLRRKMHGGRSRLGPAGNLAWAWAARSNPPGGWEGQ